MKRELRDRAGSEEGDKSAECSGRWTATVGRGLVDMQVMAGRVIKERQKNKRDQRREHAVNVTVSFDLLTAGDC